MTQRSLLTSSNNIASQSDSPLTDDLWFPAVPRPTDSAPPAAEDHTDEVGGDEVLVSEADSPLMDEPVVDADLAPVDPAAVDIDDAGPPRRVSTRRQVRRPGRGLREWLGGTGIGVGRAVSAHRATLAAGVLATAVIVGGGGLVVWGVSTSGTPASVGDEVNSIITTASATRSPVAPPPWCAADAPAGWTVSDGSTQSLSAAMGLIVKFESAYYTARSGAAARAFAAPGQAGAGVSPAAAIQLGIDTVPAGTRFCVAMSEEAPTSIAADVHELRPDASTRTYRQQFTVTAGGSPAITAITARKGS